MSHVEWSIGPAARQPMLVVERVERLQHPRPWQALGDLLTGGTVAEVAAIGPIRVHRVDHHLASDQLGSG
jgi:hypothetical protein